MSNASLHFKIMTLFPAMFPGTLGQSLAGKALERGTWSYQAYDIRDYATDKHKTVDDTPFGGGAGMVLRADVLENCFLQAAPHGRRLYLSPRGRVLDQNLVKELLSAQSITLLCGRYEGVDQRFLDAHDFEEISVGDYVLSGGEIAAQILMDACIRLLPSVMGNAETAGNESFENGLLEYPHYTRPAGWQTQDGRILNVPDILCSGNHGAVDTWRLQQSEAITAKNRPDLWQKYCDNRKK